jgi:hypothetical protein
MEDFSTFCKNMPTEDKPKWLSKNRFWNLVFWAGMSFGISLAFSMSGMNSPSGEFSLWSSFVAWLTIIGVPITVKHFSKTTFVKDSIFLDKEGQEINIAKDLPSGLLAIIATVVATFLIGAVLNTVFKDISADIKTSLTVSTFFLIPILFFIFKNCPISILFNFKCWRYLSANAPAHSIKLSEHKNYVTDPAYRHLSINLYHRHR